MSTTPNITITRRDFLGTTSAGVAGLSVAAGSLVFGFATEAAAQGSTSTTPPEITAWVVVQPDEKIIIRIARSAGLDIVHVVRSA